MDGGTASLVEGGRSLLVEGVTSTLVEGGRSLLVEGGTSSLVEGGRSLRCTECSRRDRVTARK